MAFGMPPGMADLLAKKYAIMQQQADAGMITANAASNQSMASARAMELGANYDFLGGYGSQVQGYRPAFRLTEGVGGTVSAPRAGMRRPGWNEDDPTGMRVFRGGL
jgi:hypothetical protein